MKFPFTSKRKLRAENKDLASQTVAMQGQLSMFADALQSMSILKAFPDTPLGGGNKYRTYAAQVIQLDKMFNNKADWGNELVKNIITVRSAFTIGGGIAAIPTDQGTERLKALRVSDKKAQLPELEFLRRFLEGNDLDRECAQDFANEGELEGKVLLSLSWDEEKLLPMVRHIPWTATKYEIEVADGDYKRVTGAVWKVKGREERLEPPQFVYLKFGGRTSAVNETPPYIGGIIENLENIDKALTDWRTINRLFSAPTPYMKTASVEEAKAVLENVTNANWKIGKFFAGTGEFSLVGYEGANIESLKEEITMNSKFTSGNSGVPIQFLGLPDVLSNRAVAENLMEMISTSTQRPRHVWTGGYTELMRKAIRMKNIFDPASGILDPLAVEGRIPFFTQAQMKEINDTWLPLFESNAISLPLLLSKLPDVDPDEEIERILEDDHRAAHNILNREPVNQKDRDNAPGSVGLDSEETTP